MARPGAAQELLQSPVNAATSPVANKAVLRNVERQSIRIHFDYTYINDPKQFGEPTAEEAKYCSKAGDVVTWAEGKITCRQDDVMTEEKKKAITETFDNVKAYLEETLMVDRLTSEIKLEPEQDYYPRPVVESADIVDLYVVLYQHPFEQDSAVNVFGFSVQDDKTSGRPIEGIVDVNLATIPLTSSKFDSPVGARQFFELALREMFKILGISKTHIKKWRDPTTGQPYEKLPITVFNHSDLEEGGTKKKFRILHTPKLHKLFFDRWGFENFGGDPAWPVGLELAQGDKETGDEWDSHWHARTNYNEIMVGTTFDYYRISEVTLTALEDSGWYDVDFMRAEPLEFGNYRSIIGAKQEQFKFFASAPPAEEWPDHYLLKTIPTDHPANTAIKRCTFDHRAIGTITPQKNTCGDGGGGTREGEECEYPKFYDANNTGWFGPAPFDYVLMVTPRQVCTQTPNPQTPSQSDPDAYYGNGSMCAMKRNEQNEDEPTCFKMSCDDQDKLTVYYANDKSIVCEKAGDLFALREGYQGICPDPNIICGILNYGKNYPPNPDGEGGSTGGETGGETGGGSGGNDGEGGDGNGNGSPLSDGAIAGIVIASVAVVGIIVAVVVLVKKGVMCRSAPVVAA